MIDEYLHVLLARGYARFMRAVLLIYQTRSPLSQELRYVSCFRW